MYYNKEMALREKEVAEKLIIGNNYVSARDKLQRALQLFPGLDHIAAMLAVSDILSVSKNKIPGYGIDYYWILHLIPSSSFSDIGNRYQKLLSLLLPIKTKFAGTELALKLVKEAFSVLSDKDKRAEFDLKRKTSWDCVQPLFGHDMPGKGTGINPQISSGCDMTSSGELLVGKNRVGLAIDKLSEREKDLGPDLLVSHNINKQFVNICHQEPSASSSNTNSEGKFGEEIDMPVDETNLATGPCHTSLKKTPSLSSNVVSPKRLDQDFYDFGKDRKPVFFEAGQIWAARYQLDTPQNCRYAQINSNLTSTVGVTWLKPVPISDGERRWCAAGLPVACGSFWLDLENGEAESSSAVFSYNCSWLHGVTEEQFEIYPKKGEIWALYEDWDLDGWSYNPETVKGCKFNLVEIISDFSKYLGTDAAYLVKVDGFRSIFQRLTDEGKPVILHISPSNFYMLSHKVPAYRFTGGEIDGVTRGMFELDLFALSNDMAGQNTSKLENSDTSNFTSPAGQLPSLPSVNPCPESKILEPSWSRNDFVAGQVWAVYGGKDSKPRQYMRINNVNSSNQVYVTFLEPQPTFDREFTWKRDNLAIVCGIYRATGTNANLEMSRFSHLVKCHQSTTNTLYKIYPMKREIWAMYRNWNDKWSHLDYKNSQCDVVEILSDFSEGSGITIARLTEVKGFLTFFCRQQFDGFDLTRVVSKPEFCSFSHRIPAFRVPGIGQHGIPESSWHLEPKALPLRFESKPCSITEPVTV